MGIYINPDNTLMYNSKTYSKIYIDKSMIIDYTNSVLFGEDKEICVSRPRRFGKSMAADMLTAYYSRGCDSRELFSDMKIAKTENFEKHLNKYNVLYADMQRFMNSTKNVQDMLKLLNERIVRELKKEFVGLSDSNDLAFVLEDIYSAEKIPFVFIIDEWDCVMRKRNSTEEEHMEYLDFLRILLKQQPYSALVYMTGILPIKKYGEHSALNMFNEFSMENQRNLAEYTGFTESEVEELCAQYDMDISEIKKWYNGYESGGISVYNPRSAVCAMTNRSYENYWTKTETYEALKKYIILNTDGLKEKVERMIAGDSVIVNTSKFQNDMTNLNSADDVLTLLVHLGYLTYDFKTRRCRIPNKEVASEFINCIENEKSWKPFMNAVEQSEECLKATLSGDEEKVAMIMEQTHQNNTSVIRYNDENSLSCIVTLAYYTAVNQYEIFRELPSGKGYADIAFIPRPNENVPAIVVELKKEDSPSIAIGQIKKRQYFDKLKAFSGEIILVGINYSDEKNSGYKKHRCRIERVWK